MQAGGFPPIGFIAFDLDYYTSTKRAFALFEGLSNTRVPRIYCYFDDVMWPESACHNDWIGELCAIREFNQEHEEKKLAPIHMLRHMLPHAAAWQEQMYVLHDFAHPLYCANLTERTNEHTETLVNLERDAGYRMDMARNAVEKRSWVRSSGESMRRRS